MIEMKDSGIEWIGRIPKNNNLIRNKYFINYVKGKIPNNTNEERIGKPYIGASDLENGCYSIYTTDDLPQCSKDDTLILWDGARAGLIGTGHEGIISSTVVNVLPNNRCIDKNFWYWYIKGFEWFLTLKVSGTTIPHMNRKYIEELNFIDFSIDEQIKIANFLDDKCNKIDQMIAKEQEEIEKLKEYKQSIITETVTKGIRKNISVKKINTEWIHEIPSSWKISKLKYIFKFGKGLPITKENLKEEGVPVISYGQVHSKENTGISISNDLIRYVDIEFKDNYPNCIVKKGEFIFADTSEDLDGCGNAVYNDQNDLLLAGYHSIIFKSEFSDNRYFAYLFQTDCWRSQIRCRTTGIKLFSITQKILKEVSICIPPKEEQREIANYLDTKCKKIELIIKEKNKRIDKLKMYQKSLIYECVTGKKEVF